MILTHEGQSVNFDIDYIRKQEKIGLSLSGGTDSALLYFLLCKFVPKVKIVPWCGIDLYRAAHIFYAREIDLIMKERFPNVDIAPMYEFNIDTRDPKWVQIYNETENVENIPQSGRIKQLICSHYSRELVISKSVNININALTANPPREDAKALGFYDQCEERRWPKDNITKQSKTSYKPFRLVDKKWVAGMYKQFGLMDWLYPYTQSCVGFADDTDSFTRPCEKCFWCNEKKWAFGTYDLCFDK